MTVVDKRSEKSRCVDMTKTTDLGRKEQKSEEDQITEDRTSGVVSTEEVLRKGLTGA